MQITFTIDDDKLYRVITAFKKLCPVPLSDDGTPMFADGAWAKECVRRHVVYTVARYEQQVARDRISYKVEDGIIS